MNVLYSSEAKEEVKTNKQINANNESDIKLFNSTQRISQDAIQGFNSTSTRDQRAHNAPIPNAEDLIALDAPMK